MAKREDLTGQKFGRLTALRIDPNRKYHWFFECDCGTIKSYCSSSVKRGIAKSCGCFKKDFNTQNFTIDLTGETFGKWTVLKKDLDKKADRTFWICKCECGTIRSVSGAHLRNGQSTSCRCNQAPNLTGMRFSKLYVLELLNKRTKDGDRIYKCLCDCGCIKETTAYSLKAKLAKSCGCMKSYGEYTIKKVLNEHSIKFDYEYIFKDYPSARYDFVLLDNQDNVIKIIEFDGQQHFEESRGIWGRDTTLKQRKIKDFEKDRYAQSKNIPILRIPYWDKHKITLDMLLTKVSEYINKDSVL